MIQFCEVVGKISRVNGLNDDGFVADVLHEFKKAVKAVRSHAERESTRGNHRLYDIIMDKYGDYAKGLEYMSNDLRNTILPWGMLPQNLKGL